MKSKDKFFAEEDYVDVSAKKKHNKFHSSSNQEILTDKLGNPIRVGDLTQVTLKDGTFLNECEVLEIRGGILTISHQENVSLGDAANYEVLYEVPANRVVVISI